MSDTFQTRTFKSGNSEAVRLPKELAFGSGTLVKIERSGDTLTIRALHDPDRERADVNRFLDDMLAIGTPPDGVQPRTPFEWTDRSGL